MKPRILALKSENRKGIDVRLIESPIEWQIIIVLTLIGKLGTSPTHGIWKNSQEDQGLSVSNFEMSRGLCVSHVFCYSYYFA